MSFKQDLIVFTIILVGSMAAMVMALPWATPGVVLDTFSLLIEYPFILVMLGTIVVAGLVGDRLR